MWQSFPHPKGTCDYGTCLSSTRPHQAFDVYRNASDTGLGCVLTQKYRVIAMLYELFDIINRSMSNIWSQARSMRLEIYSAANLICNFLSTKSHNETVWSGMQKKIIQGRLSRYFVCHLNWTNSSWPNHDMMEGLKFSSTGSLKERGSLNVFAATRMEFCGSNLHSGFNESWAPKQILDKAHLSEDFHSPR